jgi:long-subunit fatty acid transport protein
LKANLKRFVFSLILFSLIPFSAWAERVEIPSSPNPVGSGARAMGMGGAFIAIADDATAASWNPGGLIQLEKPEMSAVYRYVHRSEDNTFTGRSEFTGDQSAQSSDLNYLSVAYPFQAGNKVKRNMIVSLNYQQLYDFNREWYLDKTIYKQTGSLYALGLAYCAQITIDFSVGVTINYWGDFLFRNKWEQTYHQEEIFSASNGKQYPLISDHKEEFSLDGWNANLGFLWRINEHWTLGGVFKSPFTANIRHTVTDYDDNTTPESEEYHEKLSMPMSYGIGAAYRFSDEFTISGDIYRTHWNDFPVSSASDDIDPITWFRLGAEYLIVGEKIVVPIRAGIFYDPAPSKGSSEDYYGFSLGSGITCTRFSFDIAYQFRFGNDVGHYMLQGIGFSQNLQEHTVYASLVYYF